ncbi:MAG: hypothetical protein JWQ84_1752, partial [Mucilaginibacter sp.]|nr:hypothetical protein [Mucilaginibacter sp.]
GGEGAKEEIRSLNIVETHTLRLGTLKIQSIVSLQFIFGKRIHNIHQYDRLIN